jgi:purine-nucleoside phosphorylase
MILGSGCGSVISRLEGLLTVPYREIAGMPAPSTEGHPGLLHYGMMGGRNVVVLEGRVHYYEGASAHEISFPILLVQSLGVRSVILTCAAGAVSPSLHTGDLLLVEDHLNLSSRSPLREMGARGFGRFVDMTGCFDEDLKLKIRTAAIEMGVDLKSGVLAAVPGPSYETIAEIVALRGLSVDAVTMSTVPEVILSRYLGLRVACLSLITNEYSHASRSKERRITTHEDVLAVAARSSGSLAAVLESAIRS